MRIGTHEVVQRIRRCTCILVSESGRPAQAYCLPFYKGQVESKPKWTVEEFVGFLEEKARAKIEYLKRARSHRIGSVNPKRRRF